MRVSVRLDRRHAHEQGGGDFAVAMPGGDELGDAGLGRRERAGRAAAAMLSRSAAARAAHCVGAHRQEPFAGVGECVGGRSPVAGTVERSARATTTPGPRRAGSRVRPVRRPRRRGDRRRRVTRCGRRQPSPAAGGGIDPRQLEGGCLAVELGGQLGGECRSHRRPQPPRGHQEGRRRHLDGLTRPAGRPTPASSSTCAADASPDASASTPRRDGPSGASAARRARGPTFPSPRPRPSARS